MAIKKYRISLEGVPAQLISQFEGVPVLKLRIRTQFGHKEVMLREGEIIRTEDEFVKTALEGYRPPKIPKITRKPKGDLAATALTYNHTDYTEFNPFTVVANNLSHHIEL